MKTFLHCMVLAGVCTALVPTVVGQTRTASATPIAHSLGQLHFPALRDVVLPQVTRFTLPDGMQVLLLEDHDLPLIHGRALVHTGNLLDPKDKIGLAGITGEVMRTGGTVSRTGEQLDDQLESLAASVETGVGETSGSASFSALSKDTDAVLPLFADVLMHPAFRQDKLDLAKMQELGDIERRYDDAAGTASLEFDSLLYGKNTPYGWETQKATVAAITRQDLVNFYQRAFYPRNILLAVWGDFSTAAMRSKLERAFAEWKNPDVPPTVLPKVQDVARPGVFFLNRDDINQTNIRIGQLGGELRDPDYPALAVMSRILGGGFSSRLFKEVRTRLGLAYSAGGSWNADFDHPGLFELSASTKSASTVQAIQAIRQQVESMRSAEVRDDELKTAKDSVLNAFVFNFDTRAKTIARLQTYTYYDYPSDYIFKFKDAVQKVTKADVLRVAQHDLKPADFSYVVVGKSKDFDHPLTALGLPVQPLQLNSQPTVAAGAEPVPDAAAQAAGRAVLDLARAAMGGANLRAIKDVTIVAHAKAQTPAGEMEIDQTSFEILPDIVRQESVLPFGKVIVYSDGTTGWVQSPQGSMPLPPSASQHLAAQRFRDTTGLLLSDPSTRSIHLIGSDTVRGHAVKVVRIADAHAAELNADLAVDAQSGLVLRKSYHSEGGGMEGPAAQVNEFYTDYRAVAGVQVPYHVEIERDGKPSVSATVTSIKINSGLNAAELAKKP